MPASGQVTWRVAQAQYGALAQRLPDPGSVTREQWGRYDVHGHRTVYSATDKVAAYAETVAIYRPNPGLDGHTGQTPLMDSVAREWAERGLLSPGRLPDDWRERRRLYPVTLPRRGWFVDVETAESIAAISAALWPALTDLGLGVLTVAELRGPDRRVTTTIAEWIWDQGLHDGSMPHGIFYGSKLSSAWPCWAVWLRSVDAGWPVVSEPTTAGPGLAISAAHANPHLAEACELLGLTAS